jgi:membrane associated rhomboid family serine protease
MFPIKDNAPRRYTPVMTWGLIVVNVAIFMVETQIPAHTLERAFLFLGVVPARFTQPMWTLRHGADPVGFLSFLTCMFLHGGWIHVLGNMWTLWIFGDNVEDRMGSRKFLVFYLLSGLFASMIHVITNPASVVPIVGASGAIAGVMGAYYTMFPRAKITILIPIFFFPFFFEIPAVFFLAFWFVQQLFTGTLSLAAPQFAGGIAWWAHVGGFLFGVAASRLFLIGGRR